MSKDTSGENITESDGPSILRQIRKAEMMHHTRNASICHMGSLEMKIDMAYQSHFLLKNRDWNTTVSLGSCYKP